MPAVVVAAAGYAAAHGAAAIGLSAGAAAFAASAATTVIAASMAPKPSSILDSRGLTTTVRSSIGSHKIIYGTARTGGVLVHIDVTKSTLVDKGGESLTPYSKKNGVLYMVVALTLPHMGWESKPFRITHWQMSDDGGVDVALREEKSAMYAWDASEATLRTLESDTNLPTGHTVEAPGAPVLTEELYATTDGSGVKAHVHVHWVEADDAFAVRYRVQTKRAVEETYKTVAETTNTTWVLDDIAPGPLSVQILALSPLEIESAPVEASMVVEGLTAPPADVQNLRLSAQGGQAHMSWTQASDLDVRIGGRIRVRHTRETAEPTWSKGTDLVPALSGVSTHAVVPLLAGTYMVKAVDSTGNESVNASIVSTTAPQVQSMNVVETREIAPEFTGTLTGYWVDEDALTLVGEGLFDAAEGTFDEALGTFNGYGGFVQSAHYTFDEVLDLGRAQQSRVSAQFTSETIDERNVFDTTSGNFDNRTGHFDGSDLSTIESRIEMRLTEDDPEDVEAIWSAWQSIYVSDVYARAFQFRVVSESLNSSHNVYIRHVRVEVDMADKVESADITVGTSGLNVSFLESYFVPPTVGLTLQNGESGDYFTLTNLSASGFDVAVFDKTDTPVARTMSYVAKGY